MYFSNSYTKYDYVLYFPLTDIISRTCRIFFILKMICYVSKAIYFLCRSQYSSSANNTGPPGSGLHAIYKVIEPPNEGK